MGSRRTGWLGVALAGGLALTLSRGWAEPPSPAATPPPRPLVGEPGGAAADDLAGSEPAPTSSLTAPALTGSTLAVPTSAVPALTVPASAVPPGAASSSTVAGSTPIPAGVPGAGTSSTPITPIGGPEATAPSVSVLDGAPDALSSTGEILADGSLAEIRVAVLARISYPWRTRLPEWSIEFLPGRAGYLGATWTNEHRIEIYVRDGQTIDELAFTAAHELGHAVDLTYLNGEERERWLRLRGRPDAPWWTDSGASDYAVGAGDWAEAFAVWQLGGTSLSTLAGQPSAEQLRLLAELAS